VSIRYSFQKLALAATLLAVCGAGLSYAADITIGVDTADPSLDTVVDLNLVRLLPIAEENSWTYSLTSGEDPLVPREVTARVGEREKIGGGCLRLHPIVFGDELILYLGNYEDSLSLYGIYLERWRGLDDLLMKFETRKRVEWLDFQNRYISDDITPIDANSCQDTGRGDVERTGLVLLENLTLNLGESGNRRGSIDCSDKNSDLRDNFSSGQNGTGLATVEGAGNALTWFVNSMLITDLGGGAVQISMVFDPRIDTGRDDYSMNIDMVLSPDQGITSLSITDDGSVAPVDLDIHDLVYTLTASNHVEPENQEIPGGTCPEEGRFSFLLVLLLFGSAFRRDIKI
jgi:hypothetical protein